MLAAGDWAGVSHSGKGEGIWWAPILSQMYNYESLQL